MEDKRVLIVISDLHIGGGAMDPGDDHVYDNNQLSRFLQKLASSPEGTKGDVELFINGDFLEFAQTGQDVYRLHSETAWCSQHESLKKVDAILNGHPDIFEAMKQFQAKGNKITIAAGNHDVDLFWPEVQARIRSACGAVGFILGQEWYSRFGDRVRIAHGHQIDPANAFKQWDNPFSTESPDGIQRLEMCPGTFFMVHFLNKLEDKYPFADNIKPITALTKILLRDDTLQSASFVWLLTRFVARHSGIALGSDSADDWMQEFPSRFVSTLRNDDDFRKQVFGLYQKHVSSAVSEAAMCEELLDGVRLDSFIAAMMLQESDLEWMEAWSRIRMGGAQLGTEDGTLTLVRSGARDDKEEFRKAAGNALNNPETQVVVLGHTHLPDHVELGGGKQYFNPGSWTRYADIGRQKQLTLKDLKDESRYPYQLNYVYIENSGPMLAARLETYEKQEGPWVS